MHLWRRGVGSKISSSGYATRDPVRRNVIKSSFFLSLASNLAQCAERTTCGSPYIRQLPARFTYWRLKSICGRWQWVFVSMMTVLSSLWFRFIFGQKLFLVEIQSDIAFNSNLPFTIYKSYLCNWKIDPAGALLLHYPLFSVRFSLSYTLSTRDNNLTVNGNTHFINGGKCLSAKDNMDCGMVVWWDSNYFLNFNIIQIT